MRIGLHAIYVVFLSDFNETSRQVFEKYSDIERDENPSSGSRIFPCGERDRHEETNSHFSHFCERF